MEPLSFTASLVTVGALFAACSRKIYNIRGKLKNAPKDVENLLEQLQTFNGLMTEMEKDLQEHRSNALPQETLQQIWGNSIMQMQRDMQGLEALLAKVEALLKKKSRSSKLLLFVRQTISEKDVALYLGKIHTHCGTLSNIQALVCGRKVERLSESTNQHRQENRSGFSTIASQLSDSSDQSRAENRAGFSTVSSHLTDIESTSEGRHEVVLSRLSDHADCHNRNTREIGKVFQKQLRTIDINEAGFQAIQSGLARAASTSRDGHETTHSVLSQCQGYLQQIVRDRVAFGNVEYGGRSQSKHSGTAGCIKTPVFWIFRSCNLPVGNLHIVLKRNRGHEHSRDSTSQGDTETEIAVTFVPPRWLSSTIVEYSMKLDYEAVSSKWHWGAELMPLTVNYNPIFMDAVRSVDAENVGKCFEKGIARATDYLPSWYDGSHPVPWHEVRRRSIFNEQEVADIILKHLEYGTVPHKEYLPRMSSMFKLMIKEGLPGQAQVLCDLASEGYLLTPPSCHEAFRNQFLHAYLEHGGRMTPRLICCLSLNGLFSSVDWIGESLLHSSEMWLADDLSSIEICLVGIVSHLDTRFCDRVKKELASCRSPLIPNRTQLMDSLFEAKFGKASLASHFGRLNEPRQREGILCLLCRTGSAGMLRLFINMGVDVNKGIYSQNFHDVEIDRSTGTKVCLENLEFNILGNAAAAGNVDLVYSLLEAGAESALALYIFLVGSGDLSNALFQHLLSLLIEKARYNPHYSIWPRQDALLAVIESTRALSFHPEAPLILLDGGVFSHRLFGRGPIETCYSYSYMFQAIRKRSPLVVELLLQRGIHASAHICHSFICDDSSWIDRWVKQCTWLTLSVILGAASCVHKLLQHGADVTALDGGGRSAIQLARCYAVAFHPREVKPIYSHFPITAEDDTETLAVVTQAFDLKSKGHENSEDYIESSCGGNDEPVSCQEKGSSCLQTIFRKTFGFVVTPNQAELLEDCFMDTYRNLENLWSLSFYEALLVRLVFVLSWTLLFGLELLAFTKGNKHIKKPSRFVLSAVALLMLAFIFGSSHVDLHSRSTTI